MTARIQRPNGVPLPRRHGFTLLESAVMLLILSVWSLVTYAVVSKKPSDVPPTMAPQAEIKVMESPVGDEPDAVTRSETREDLLPEPTSVKTESR